MALKVVWTPQAMRGLENVIDYLEKNWTVLEILNLENNILQIIRLIQNDPEIFPNSYNFKNIRKALIDKNNYLLYQFNSIENQIIIINFRGTKQNPL